MAEHDIAGVEACLASHEESQEKQQQHLEERVAQLEEKMSQVEERVVRVEGSQQTAPNAAMAERQSPAAGTSVAPAPANEAASAAGPSTAAACSASGLEHKRPAPSAPTDGRSKKARTSLAITDPAALHQQKSPSQTGDVATSQLPSGGLPASLHEAAAQGDVAALQRMLDGGGLVDARDRDGNTALHFASSYGRVEAVELLIARGAFIDRYGKGARTPLHCAAAGGHLETVARLVAAGAKLEERDSDGATALTLAVIGGHKEVVAFLQTKGANVDCVDKNGETTLHHAAKGGHLEMARLLTAGANSEIDSEGATALSIAVKEGRENVDLPLKKKENPNATDKNGDTPLHHAAKGGQRALVSLLLQMGANPSNQNNKRESPMYLAAKMGKAEALEEMLKVGPPEADEVEKCLCVAGSAEVVWALVDAARDVVLGRGGEEALRLAARYGRLEALDALLNVGVDPNCKDECRSTPLHKAAHGGHASCVRRLLQAGADKKVFDYHNRTPLGCVQGSESECAKLLQ